MLRDVIIRTANRIDDVLSVLEFAEREELAGSHVAVMLSYEAAPAFDPSLVAHAPLDFPLAWSSVFEDVPAGEQLESYVSTEWEALVTRDEYDGSVSRIRELIAAGDTYQVNYSFPLTSSFNGGHAFAWYRDLCVAQGAQYSAY